MQCVVLKVKPYLFVLFRKARTSKFQNSFNTKYNLQIYRKNFGFKEM